MDDYCSPDGKTELHHRDGVAWLDAPMPWRFHRCSAQTYGYFNYSEQVERCACGAIRLDGRSHWMNRNSRKD